MTSILDIIIAEGVLLLMSTIVSPFGYLTGLMLGYFEFALELSSLADLGLTIVVIWVSLHVFGLVVFVTMRDTVEEFRQ